MSETSDIKPATPATGRSAGTGVLIAAAVLLALGWIQVATIRPASHDVMIGLMFGTMFGHVSLSAAWCALGPFTLMWRLPLTSAWLAATTLAFGWNVAMDGGGELIIVLVFGGGMLLQWLLVQAPLWLLAVVYGVRVVHGDDPAAASDRRDHQFGIRQLMILTALVAIVLAVGRWTLGGLSNDEYREDWLQGVGILSFLGVCNALIAFPLVAAALLPRRFLPAIVAAVGLVALATAVEVSLMEMIEHGDNWILWIANFVQAAWILGLFLLLRLGGYRLTSRSRAAA